MIILYQLSICLNIKAELLKRKVLSYIGSFLLLAVILHGSAGMTFSFHSCSVAMTTEVSIYPELFSNRTACCCQADVSATASFPAPTGADGLDASECCRISKAFYKVAIFGNDEKIKIVATQSDLLYPIESVLKNFPLSNEFNTSVVIIDDPSPPLYGKQLVYFLNQPKIPVFVS
jgi:hypothetical protein